MTALFFILAATAAQATTETPVVTGSADQFGPSATTGWISWTQVNPVTKKFATYVQDAGPATTINKPGTDGYGGGFNGLSLTYQQVPKDSNSDVFTYDLGTDTRAPVDAANSRFWEWEPTASGDWVLFGRNNSNVSPRNAWNRIILVNTSTLEVRTLADAKGTKVSLRAGQVNGDTASYERCSTTDCEAFFYDISSQVTTSVSTSALEYAPAVAADGTQYFFRSGKGCGQNVRIYRQEPGDPTPTLIYTFPAGVYGADAYVYSNGVHETLYYARASCSGGKFDVYAIEEAQSATALARAAQTSGRSSRAGGPGMAERLSAPTPGSSASLPAN